MLTVHHAGAIQNFWIDGERKTYVPACSDSSRHAYNMKGFLAFRHCLERPCIQNLWMSPNLKSHYSRLRNHHLWRTSKDGTRKNWLCHWDSNASSDHDYRSSRNIAISLLKRYRIVIDRGGGDNLKEFISAGVNAYALGCTDEGLRKELIRMKDSGAEIEGLQSHSGGTTLKFEILTEELSGGHLRRRCQLKPCINGKDFVLSLQMLIIQGEWHAQVTSEDFAARTNGGNGQF
ncbi:uncharacterized protein LOC103996158 isoform X3 [Musa acuminata AAA Group]|uniref:uncharacterized protein LOC103996158 isoform X3 n=1 Tax=Musa acuminata AAA Group TaxID=214697 RepID=UPI0031E0CCCF